MPVINPRTGKEFRWANNPKPTTRAEWSEKSMYGQTVKGTVRSIAHLDWLNNRAKHRYGKELVIIQPAFNDLVRASKGTHDYDMVYDVYIPGVGYWETQRFLRAHGFFCWYRPANSLWSNHVHGFSMPHWTDDPSKAFMQHGFKVGVYIDGGWSLYGKRVATSQVEDQINEAFGLSGQHSPHSDRSWFPDNKEATVFDLSAYKARNKKKQAA